MLNKDLLERTMSYIEAHPEEHDQTRWANACGTAFCFAGHAAILSGATRPQGLNSFWGITPDGRAVDYFETTEDGALLAFGYARQKLGLNFPQASALFSSANTVESLREMVDALKADPDAHLEPLVPEDEYADDEDEGLYADDDPDEDVV